jgi:hypothetical protein
MRKTRNEKSEGENTMKKSVLLLSAAAFLFFAAVPAAVAQKAKNLTEVAHDSTLKGDGTADTPLGVADGGVGTAKIATGAVTAAKLAAANAQNGQVLTYTANGLSWQTPAAGPEKLRNDHAKNRQVGEKS